MSKLLFYIIGEKKYSFELLKSMKSRNVIFEFLDEEKAMSSFHQIKSNCVGYILVPPFSITNIVFLLRHLNHLNQSNNQNLPKFVISDRRVSETAAREFYKNGAVGVFNFTDDKKKMLKTLLILTRQYHESFADEDKREYINLSVKQKILRVLKTRFKISEKFSAIKLRLRERFRVILKGKVKSPYQERRAVEIASMVPGIGSVDHHHVEINSNNNVEIEIKKKIALLLNILEQRGIESKVNFKVQGSTIFISGEIIKLGEEEFIYKCVERLKGVNQIINNMYLSDELIENSEQVLRQVEDQLLEQFTSLRDVKLEQLKGNIVKISGQANIKAVKNLISDYVLQNSKAKDVVNNITIQ